MIKREQDAAYEQSLAADRAKVYNPCYQSYCGPSSTKKFFFFIISENFCLKEKYENRFMHSYLIRDGKDVRNILISLRRSIQQLCCIQFP